MVGQPLEWIIPGYKESVEQARERGRKTPVVEVTGVHKSGKQVEVELSLGEYKKTTFTSTRASFATSPSENTPTAGSRRSLR